MKAPLFDKILVLSQAIAGASANEKDDLRLIAYNKLQALCLKAQGSPDDHPLQWEALADFTEDGDLALDIYKIALEKAEKFTLNNFSASIHLAMALRFQEFEELDKAREQAQLACDYSEKLDNTEGNNALKEEISELLASL